MQVSNWVGFLMTKPSSFFCIFPYVLILALFVLSFFTSPTLSFHPIVGFLSGCTLLSLTSTGITFSSIVPYTSNLTSFSYNVATSRSCFCVCVCVCVCVLILSHLVHFLIFCRNILFSDCSTHIPCI